MTAIPSILAVYIVDTEIGAGQRIAQREKTESGGRAEAISASATLPFAISMHLLSTHGELSGKSDAHEFATPAPGPNTIEPKANHLLPSRSLLSCPPTVI